MWFQLWKTECVVKTGLHLYVLCERVNILPFATKKNHKIINGSKSVMLKGRPPHIFTLNLTLFAKGLDTPASKDSYNIMNYVNVSIIFKLLWNLLQIKTWVTHLTHVSHQEHSCFGPVLHSEWVNSLEEWHPLFCSEVTVLIDSIGPPLAFGLIFSVLLVTLSHPSESLPPPPVLRTQTRWEAAVQLNASCSREISPLHRAALWNPVQK